MSSIRVLTVCSPSHGPFVRGNVHGSRGPHFQQPGYAADEHRYFVTWSFLLTVDVEWHEVALRDTILRVVARISSRVFLGEQLCRNEEWLRVTREYTVTVFNAAQDLRMYPSFLRPIVCRFLPGCKEAKAQVAKAREVIAPVLKSRQAMKKKAADAGERYTESNDAIDWFEELSDGKNYDPAMTQLGLSFAAIHTTTDLLTQTLIDIAAHPEIKEALREEMVRILQTDGWAKTAFYKMKLLDSTIKESQRLKPISMSKLQLLPPPFLFFCLILFLFFFSPIFCFCLSCCVLV